MSPSDRVLSFIRLGGSGPNILLLHGFGADRMTWIANQDVLVRSGTVFACDLPAHGEEPPLQGTTTLPGIADLLIETLDRSGERYILVGHSLGGAIAIELAARRPDLVAGLALIAPAGLGGGLDRGFLVDLPSLNELEAAQALLRRLVARPRLITPVIAERLLKHLNKDRVRPALRELADDLAQIEGVIEGHVACVAASDIPRMVIWGEEDRINPVNLSKLAEFNAQVLTVPETGHLPHVEASGSVNGNLSKFISTLGVRQEV